ncbi:DUF2007 domain-containing protein [Anaerosalibacter bizertensis]|uniref:DUF2007 domain-containing protein n=1 Tax=Anaerosalibacter bizertensis TaxID=932217 RepID=A0A844FGX5_9FIRM|nr:DUF2007 domain-containing protein [Anaerosalibacter bizertensis]
MLKLIKDLLDQHKIPYIIKDRESGDYMKIYSGFSIYGTDILVEKSLLKKQRIFLMSLLLNNSL